MKNKYILALLITTGQTLSIIIQEIDDPAYDSFIETKQSPVDFNINGEIETCLCFLNNGDTFFDVGANFGIYTMSLLKHRQIKAHCFEPIPQIFAAMKRNFKEYGPSQTFNTTHSLDEYLKSDFDRERWCKDESLQVANSVIYAVNAGLSSKNYTTQMFFYPSSGEVSCVSGLYHEKGFDEFLNIQPIKVDAEVLAIDDYCTKNNIENINYLKIDTEGNDFLVMLGAQNMISNHKISCIQFEYMVSWQHANSKLKQAFDFLIEHDYKIYKIFSDKIIRVSYWRDSLENYIYSNYLAIRSK